MKCPYCGQEMMSGEIMNQQGSMIYWQPVTEELFKTRLSKASVEKHGGVVLARAQTLVSEPTKGYLCKECKKCIISFEE